MVSDSSGVMLGAQSVLGVINFISNLWQLYLMMN